MHCSPRPEWAPILKSNIQKLLTRTGNAAGTISAVAKQAGNLADWTTPPLE